jgi:hypothetical protein
MENKRKCIEIPAFIDLSKSIKVLGNTLKAE